MTRLKRSLILSLCAAALVPLAGPVGAAQARSCRPIEIQFRSNQPRMQLKVSAKGVTCAGARPLAKKIAQTRGLFTPEKFICSVQTGPTIGACWSRDEKKRFSWNLAGVAGGGRTS